MGGSKCGINFGWLHLPFSPIGRTKHVTGPECNHFGLATKTLAFWSPGLPLWFSCRISRLPKTSRQAEAIQARKLRPFSAASSDCIPVGDAANAIASALIIALFFNQFRAAMTSSLDSSASATTFVEWIAPPSGTFARGPRYSLGLYRRSILPAKDMPMRTEQRVHSRVECKKAQAPGEPKDYFLRPFPYNSPEKVHRPSVINPPAAES